MEPNSEGARSLDEIVLSWLSGVELWLRVRGLRHRDLDAWLDHLYHYVTLGIGDPRFQSWLESGPTGLIDIQKGADLPLELERVCQASRVPPDQLRTVISSMTDLVYGPLYSQVQWGLVDESVELLRSILDADRVERVREADLPPLERAAGEDADRVYTAAQVAEVRARVVTGGT